MKNNASVTVRVCATLAASIFAFACASVNAANLASADKTAADFHAIADSDLLVLGPVDLVESSKTRVQILGQWIPVSESQLSQSPDGLVGHVLAVYGSVAPDGSLEIAAVREQESSDYVPGATHVYLKGSISELDSLHGTARIGTLSVNYSNALHTLVAQDLSVGAVVSFRGLRFTESNKLYADDGLVHNATSVVQTLGQTGSGFRAEVRAAGQTGSGFQAAGQTGSGFRAAGQTGSGFHAAGQTGSGFQAAGQTGSGLRAAGQTGSGFRAAGGQTKSGVKL